MKKFYKTIGLMKKFGMLALALLVCAGIGVTDAMVVHAENTSAEDSVVEEISELEVAEVEETLATTEASSGTWGDLSWSYSNGTLTISYSGSMSGSYMAEPDSAQYYYDPADTETLEEVASDYPWYTYRDSVTKIVINDGVESIGGLAFYNMTKLETVSIVESDSLLSGVGSIGDYAFGNCTSLTTFAVPAETTGVGDGVFYNCTALQKVTGDVPTSAYAFYGCKSLTDIGTLDGAYIHDYAFAYCSGLKTVDISSDVLYIESYSFAYCTGLTGVTIPESVIGWGDYAFTGCTGLQEVTMESDRIDGSYTFKDCTGITKVNLPEDGCYIGEGTFYNCPKLNEITGSVSFVDEYAFYNCKKLADTSWADGLSAVGDYAYYGCAALTEVTIGSGAVVGEYAFYGSTALNKVVFNGGITEIGSSAFMNCGLKEVWMNNTTSISTVFSGDDIFKGNTGCKIYGLLSCSGAKEIAADSGCTYVPTDTLDKPVHSTITNETTGVHVYWDAVDYALTYNLYRSSSANGTYTLIKSGLKATDYIDVNVQAGSAYYYKVVAVGELVKSPYSAASKGITHVSVPGFKKIVNVVSGVHVYWNAADGAKTYNVYRSTQKASGYTLIKKGLTATHYIDTTAVSGNTYYYKVVAVNGTSTSADTEPFKAIIYVGTPDITSRANSAYGIRLGWNKIDGATGYAIYRKPYSSGSWVRVATIEGNSTFTWTDSSVKANNGTVYRYTIRALAGDNMSTLSGCRNTGRTMTRLTSRTLNSAVKTSATSIKCNWTTTSVCDGYEVRFMIGSSVYETFTVGNYKTGVKTFTGLKAGQTYKIQVRTYKKVEGVGTFYSAWSTAKTVSL